MLRFVSFDKDDDYDDDGDDDDADDSDDASASVEVLVPFLFHLAPIESSSLSSVSPPFETYGLTVIDHAVGNVSDFATAAQYIKASMGYHEFAEFNSADVGTVDSGLNSIVLASDTERLLLPLNEPTDGTKRKSQIRTRPDCSIWP